MRLPYVPNPPNFSTPTDQAILQRVQDRRSPRGLLELDLALLHSPPIADGWNTFLGAIRTRTALPPTVRELAICRVAVLNRAWYEWADHAPLLRATGVLSDADMAYIARRRARTAAEGGVGGVVADGGGTATAEEDVRAEERLGEALVAVLDYTDAMTVDVRVPEGVFARVRRAFGEREVVELTATVAAYNCVSRFLVALDVGERNGDAGPSV